MKRAARMTLLLTPTKATPFSKLGGEPELPIGVEWPAGERYPRAFLAQIDLAEAQKGGLADWLPSEGRFWTPFMTR